MTRYDTELGESSFKKKKENKPEVTHGTAGFLLIVANRGSLPMVYQGVDVDTRSQRRNIGHA